MQLLVTLDAAAAHVWQLLKMILHLYAARVAC